MIAGSQGVNENEGSVWAVHLAYSGNHKLVAEKLLEGTRHIQTSEWLYPGEISLATDQNYQTPITKLSYGYLTEP